MADTRHKNIKWILPDPAPWDAVKTAVLMDIRDELQKVVTELQSLNRVFNCSNFLALPTAVRAIAKNTTKRPRVRKEKT